MEYYSKTIQIDDRADEFRVEIFGRFSGSVVDHVQSVWDTVLKEMDSRRFVVDITRLSSYDYAGLSLLAKMHRYGVHISAASPGSLVFLNEISNPRKAAPFRQVALTA